MKKNSTAAILAAALVICGGLFLMLHMAVMLPDDHYEIKVQAAEQLRLCMESVRQYKLEQGIGLSAEDRNGTGLIGAAYTPITTTSGALEAKRTAADPVMAALMVELLQDAGLHSGDTVALGFSGSFPGMNLAALCACECMELRPVCIASVGASTYGANQPEMTFPDMMEHLREERLIRTGAAAFSPGGQADCGLDMDQEVLSEIESRLTGYGIPLLKEEDFQKNLEKRQELYAAHGEVKCFVGVGGNLTTAGTAPGRMLPYGLLPGGKITEIDEYSGLLERYNAEGIPVIHILNLKQLAADHNIPFDPREISVPGEGEFYYRKRYPMPVTFGTLLSAGGILLWDRRNRNRKKIQG